MGVRCRLADGKVRLHSRVFSSRDYAAAYNRGVFFFVGPAGRTHLEGESPLYTRQGEVLARGKGFVGDCESGGSPRQSAGLTNRKRIRGGASG